MVSRRLASVGPNAHLVTGDLGAAVRGLKARLDGEIEMGGPNLAQRLTVLGLIVEYRLYLHPVVLGQGTPFFGGPLPELRLKASEQMAEGVMRLCDAPA